MKSLYTIYFAAFKQNPFYKGFIFYILSLINPPLHAQENIPIGSWRVHLSFNSIHAISPGIDKVYAATINGIMIYDREDQSITQLSKLSGLTGTSITSILYDEPTRQLIIAYDDGNIDLVKEKGLTNFSRLKVSNTLTGSKRINNITAHQGLVYLSADFGVVVFDPVRREIKETWRDLGADGSNLKILQSTFRDDSIFLATEKGVITGNLTTNLLDYNNWKRFQEGNFTARVHSIVTLNDIVYATIHNAGIYYYETDTWIPTDFLQNEPVLSLFASSNNLLITQYDKVWKFNTTTGLNLVTSNLIAQPNLTVADELENIWIGDNINGLLSNISGSYVSYLLNGPTLPTAFRLKYHQQHMYAVQGGFSSSYLAVNNPGIINIYNAQGQWTSENSGLPDITDIDFVIPDKPAISTFGHGVQIGPLPNPDVLYNETNSTLINTNAPGTHVNITTLERSPDGLWVSNYGAPSPLHLLKPNNTWEAFSFAFNAARYPTEIVVDHRGSVWALLNPSQGGGILVFNKNENKVAYLTDQPTTGGLPSRAVRSIAVDRDGYVWLGTDRGISYFFSPSAVFGSNVDAVEPIFENRYLLSDERITAITIDGGNRKWIGTQRGVWLFNSTAEELIYNFTEENSPLLSNVIRDIEINPTTGEVFFATDKGIVSFRSDASESQQTFQHVKIFPNPVTDNFNGSVGISGLSTDAFVKITDVSGKLLWQTQANGGTATWNVHDYNGKRASSGIYLVFSASQDGTESFVGKIAVIE